MNKKISANEFRESLDRHASDLKANPWLAQGIIASEMKGETKVKRKWTTSVIIALLMILALGTVAYGVTSLWRTVSWQGEVINTVEQEIEIMPEENLPMYNKLLDYIFSLPEEEMAEAWFDDGNEVGSWNSTVKWPSKHFNCAEDFLDFMSGVTTLTAPARFPEGEYDSFDAEVRMICRDSGKYELIESGEKDSIHYTRFCVDEKDLVPNDYYVNIRMKDGTSYFIQGTLWPEDTKATALEEGETVEKVQVNGMDDVLLIRDRMDDLNYDVIMRRKLDEPIGWKNPDGPVNLGEESGYFYNELVIIWGPRDVDPAELAKLFDRE